MPFPFSRTREFPVAPGWTASALLLRCQSRLVEFGATEIQVVGERITFSVPWMQVSGPLFCCDSGQFDLIHDSEASVWGMRYRLSFKRKAILVAILVVGWLGFASGMLHEAWVEGAPLVPVAFLVVAYCWMFGAWYLIVPIWLERRLSLRPVGIPPTPVS